MAFTCIHSWLSFAFIHGFHLHSFSAFFCIYSIHMVFIAFIQGIYLHSLIAFICNHVIHLHSFIIFILLHSLPTFLHCIHSRYSFAIKHVIQLHDMQVNDMIDTCIMQSSIICTHSLHSFIIFTFGMFLLGALQL